VSLTTGSERSIGDANLALVRQWFALLSEGRVDEAATLTDPTGLLWSPRLRIDKRMDDWHASYARFLEERFPDGLPFHEQLIVTEGDRVAVMNEAHGTQRDGRDYHNHYLWYLEADGSRITRVREYNDTHYAHVAFEDAP
jgi:ketosteroid isomerase-like protein